jgi:hypothetical protein
MSDRLNLTGVNANGQSRPTPLSARQERLAVALAAGQRDTEACRVCRVGLTTLRNWRLGNPLFTARVRELRTLMVETAINRLADLMCGKALDALTARLSRVHPETGELVVSLDDIKAAFELYCGVTSASEVQSRLELIEQAVRGRKAR